MVSSCSFCVSFATPTVALSSPGSPILPMNALTFLSFEGNTAPYLQYAYARIQSLFRRGGIDPSTLQGESPGVAEPDERQLAAVLVRFQETLEQVAAEALPHYLCTYLFEVASKFMRFYEHCPVLDADPETRDARLRLCARTAETLRQGLGFLGIETVDRM